jgi:hypothetical protein
MRASVGVMQPGKPGVLETEQIGNLLRQMVSVIVGTSPLQTLLFSRDFSMLALVPPMVAHRFGVV